MLFSVSDHHKIGIIIVMLGIAKFKVLMKRKFSKILNLSYEKARKFR